MLRLEDWISLKRAWGKGSYSLRRKMVIQFCGEVACLFPLGANWRKMCVCVGGALGAEVSRVISVWGGSLLSCSV